MNKVVLIGRLTRDPVISWTQGQKPICVARYTLAVDRRFVRKDGNNDQQQTADFIQCAAFDKNGEFAEKYLRQGTKIAIEGRIQTGSYTNREGQRVFTTDVVVEAQEFAESKGVQRQNGMNEKGQMTGFVPVQDTNSDGFMNLPDDVDDEGLPFN